MSAHFHNRRLVLAAAIASAILFSVAAKERSGTVSASPAAPGRRVIPLVSTDGTIEPAAPFLGYAREPGTVTRLLVQQGRKVRRGQLLLQLDASGASQQLAHALAQLRAAEAELDRIAGNGSPDQLARNIWELRSARRDQVDALRELLVARRLHEMGANSAVAVRAAQDTAARKEARVALDHQKVTARYSPADRSRAEAQVRQARAAYAAAQVRLHNRGVVSSMDGTVYNLNVRQGQYVNAGELMVRVADLSHVAVRTFVDESDLGRLSLGQAINVHWSATPGRSWTTAVERMPSTVVAHGRRTVGEVLSSLDNSDGTLLPGAHVTVEVSRQ